MKDADWLPWDRPAQIALWAVAIIIATVFIHNFVRIGSRHVGDAAAQ